MPVETPIKIPRLLFLVGCLLLPMLAAPGLSGDSAPDECEPAAGLEFVCGMENAEDLTWLGDTGLMIVSGLAGRGDAGHLYLFDPETRAVDTLFPDGELAFAHDRETYSDCPGPPDTANFSPHGVSVKAVGEAAYRLYLVAHGARESVEVFDIDHGAETALTWVGCVEFPEGDSINSVAALPDGGFLATRLSSAGDRGLMEAVNGEETGFLYRWSPGAGLMQVAGTRMSGPNGIEVSSDGEQVHVASWGHSKVVSFAWTSDGGLEQVSAVSLEFRPDNLRLTPEGNVLTAGHRLRREDCPRAFCVESWGVAEVNPGSGAANTLLRGEPLDGFMGPTVALGDGEGVWLGTFGGDRIAYFRAGDGFPH